MFGCGTSSGVPVVGCDCAVCVSGHPKNRRLRASLRISWRAPQGPQAAGGDEGGGGPEFVAVVDVGPDFRQQALTFGLPRLDAVLLTHAHADHIMGLDDVRVFNFRQGGEIPLYGNGQTLRAIRHVFSYAFEESQEGGGKPKLSLCPVSTPFELGGRLFTPLPIFHGSLPILGYRCGDLAYITDCSEIPESTFALLEGVQVLILDALRYHPHSTHFSLNEAIAASERIGARRTIFTHLAHDIDYRWPRFELPPGMEFGYDGLSFSLP